ncbi:hypothetical protein [Profundibacterium mesophilum]|uniref:Uncharacterized protein n=1 Tax=Profundibacterium mesophilum KAUST100406-0324 TaxID=1037889 RepID=A0A921NSS8_9RHOB|nr:hypothetical protein [Profundibacterium mesophilum]KAF0677282.1 hypothetical protein PMES_00329 [Profundibacterium mesophilum KAUST100406-0324]
MRTGLIVQSSALVAEDIKDVVCELFPGINVTICADFRRARDWLSRAVSLDLAIVPARDALAQDRKIMSAFALYGTRVVLIAENANPLGDHLPKATVLRSPFTDEMLHAALTELKLSDA